MRAMPELPSHDALTALLQAWSAGDRDALAQLLRQVHDQLCRMACARLRGLETPSLAPGDLLHEALLKLMQAPPDWEDRRHFFAHVSLAMRSVLVDHARARQSARRGGGRLQLSWSALELGEDDMAADLIDLDRLLHQLAAEDPRAAELLQMAYFAGLERQQIAEVSGMSLATVDRELRFARAWLQHRLGLAHSEHD